MTRLLPRLSVRTTTSARLKAVALGGAVLVVGLACAPLSAQAATAPSATIAAASPASASLPAAGLPAAGPAAAAIQAESVGTVYPGGLFVAPDSTAEQADVALTATGDTAGAAAAAYIAKQSVAVWLTNSLSDALLVRVIDRNLANAEAQGTTPVFVTYAIPDRDCGGYSAGGLTDATYPAWSDLVASTLKGHNAVVMVEPDSLSTCPSQTTSREALIANAVQTFTADGIPTYLDGGSPNSVTAQVAAARLEAAGIADARGFFSNVASYYSVDPVRDYDNQISALTGDSHFVIDVSRDGRGWQGTWCNAPGAGLGQDPHVSLGDTGLDALLWIKSPGVSDGTCNGGPAAGDWFASYAESLVALRE
jgi:endoglucanase